ncbi:hypothetical protein HN51_016137 [Arachis hypogaea]
MFIISSFLAPTSSTVTSPKHLRAIVDVENITRYNWARFMHDELIKWVQKFKEKNSLSIDGCLYVSMGIVTLLVKQGVVDAKFTKNTTRAPTNLAKKRGVKELNKDNTMKEKKERFDEQNNDNKMSKEDDNVSDEKKDKESDAKQDEEKEVKTREDKKDENNMRSPM